MSHATRRPRGTVEDYMALPDEMRAELLEGELYVTPAPEVAHQRVVFRLARRLADHVEAKGAGEVIPSPMDVHLPTGDVVQPDVLFVSNGNRSIVRRWIRGAPDLLIEVLSPARPERDRFVKRVLYERGGIREYWIVDPEEESAEVLRLVDGAYRAAGFFRSPQTLVTAMLPGFALPLGALFGT